MNKQKISVLIDVPLNCCFDYWSESKLNLKLGQRVSVPFGNRKEQVGIVSDIQPLKAEEIDLLKPVTAYLDAFAIVNLDWLEFIKFSSRYYACPIGKVFKNASPNYLRINQPLLKPIDEWLVIGEQGEIAIKQGLIKKNAMKQKALLHLLQKSPILKKTLVQQGFNANHWRSLVEKSYVKIEHRPVYQQIDQAHNPSYELNDQQQKVVNTIDLKAGFCAHLIYGVTGSGKTEVYLQLIAKILKLSSNKPLQVLVLVPEIALAPQMISRFESRFGHQVAIYHSEISQRKKIDCFLSTGQGEVSIVIGTRSAIFLPFNHLGLIIVDEEHDISYKQDKGFRYHARDLAIYRAKAANIPIVLGSATPSLESIYNVENQKMIKHQLTERATQSTLPSIKMIDRRGEYKTQALSPKLEQAMRQTLHQNRQVILFLNRRGYSPVLMCDSCDWRSHCDQCACYQTSHVKSQRLICHHCGSSQSLPKHCPSCYQDTLFFVGVGTEKLFEYLSTQFPHHKILTIDRDTQTTAKQLAKALDQVTNHEVDIVIGTQMLVKGHHFPHVDMVGVVDADGGLFSPEFRAEEKLYQQLIQISGRAGRESSSGKVYIQSQVPQHELFKALIHQDYWQYAKTLLSQREMYHLPPYYALTQIINIAKDEQQGIHHLQQVKSMLEEHQNELTVQGPVTMPLEKKENKHYSRLLVTAPTKEKVQKHLRLIQSIIQYLGKQSKTQIQVDVDAI